MERKEKFMLFSDHNGSLLRQQPGATDAMSARLFMCTEAGKGDNTGSR